MGASKLHPWPARGGGDWLTGGRRDLDVACSMACARQVCFVEEKSVPRPPNGMEILHQQPLFQLIDGAEQSLESPLERVRGCRVLCVDGGDGSRVVAVVVMKDFENFGIGKREMEAGDKG
ncbi:hypothetical protein AAHE18_02G044900 [Arachis hypogaea]